MKEIEDIETTIKWSSLLEKLKTTFGDIEDVKDVVFLVGVQELGKGYQEFNKDQKIDVMHIGICHLLSRYGYYNFEGIDKEGWPHWKLVTPLPFLNEKEKELLLKKSLIEYFDEKEEP